MLDGQQLFNLVRRSVILNASQTPEYTDIRYAGHEGGDFLFVRQAPSKSARAAGRLSSVTARRYPGTRLSR